MPLVSENIALIVFALVIIGSAILAWWMGSYSDYDKGSFHTFIAILAGLGVIVTYLFYYNVLLLQGMQQQLAAVQEFSRINESVSSSILDGMNESSEIIPNFVISLTPLTNEMCCFDGETGATGCDIPTQPDPVTPQTCTEKMVLSYKIFSRWQEVIMSDRFMTFDIVPYITNFLQRANSKQLFSQWIVSKINFTPDTQTLGDLLFEYGLPITVQIPQSYIDAATKLTNDPRYKDLLKN